ncbi:MAG: HD domain-containing protein [Deltaproteobacteria bacterium]|nr:HD domain-containing protein [Deltaproteobacteria bacterium]
MKCPGQDTRYWKADDIFEAACPHCGAMIEFFKDDATRRCRQCQNKVANPKMDFGCASYCKFADQCLTELPHELLAGREDLLKNRVAVEMKQYFGSDFKRIRHALEVARYAERIAKKEPGDPAVVLIAAYLHDIGIPEAEEKYGSSAARYQEELGPLIARRLLQKVGAEEALINEVCDIVGHHHSPRSQETDNFKIIYDADLLVNVQAGADGSINENIAKNLFTDSARNIALNELKR